MVIGTYLAQPAGRFDSPLLASAQPALTKISCRWHCARLQQDDGTPQPRAETHLYRSRYAPAGATDQQVGGAGNDVVVAVDANDFVGEIVIKHDKHSPSFIGVARGHQ